jgi:hypothetical protein
MKICGWKTRQMFERYNIVNKEDVREALAALGARRVKPKRTVFPLHLRRA